MKYVTVLFADIVGSTGMVADRSPDDARELLAPIVAIMTEAVRGFGGAVNQSLGDGVMALFGVPLSQEDHALRACCAAHQMHAAAAALPHPVRLRVGVASGLTLLSTGGIEAAGAYPAFGATVHMASRLQALARPGTTLCGASTHSLAGAGVHLVPLGPQALRGFPVEQAVFAMAGLRQRGEGFSRSASRGLSRLVGRDRELARMSAQAHLARSGTPARVALVGEAGAGKSRLAWEFVERLRADPMPRWQLVRAEALSYGRSVPTQLIAALLRAGLALPPRTAPAEAAARLEALLGPDAPPDCVPALLSLLELPLGVHAATWDLRDPLRRRDLLQDSVRVMFAALCHQAPTLLLVEDLQWADDESLRLLHALPAHGLPLLTVLTYRPDFTPSATAARTEVIELQPLSAESMGRILAHAFPLLDASPVGTALIERSAGNPFFLEELAREALRSPAPVVPVPPTIQSVVAARIDRLAADAKRVLVTAAALGNRFPLRTLHAVMNGPDTQRLVGRLCEAGLFRPLRPADEDAVFSHALIQEVAYAGLPRGQCRALHASVVGAIKRMPGAAEMAETLAYHASRGEAWEELIDAAETAGRRAVGRSAYLEATRFFDAAIDACARVPRSAAVLAREIDLRFELRAAIFPTSGLERSLQNSLSAERLARQINDPARLGWATAYVAKDLQLVGRPQDSLAAAARAAALAGEDRNLVFAARYFASQAHYARGDYALAVSGLQALVARVEADDPRAWIGTPGPSVFFAQVWMAWSEARLGRAADAAATSARMHRLANETELPLLQTLALLTEGFTLAFEGRLPEAEAALRRSLQFCRKWEFFAWFTNIASCLGHVLSRLGQSEEAIDLLGQAIEQTRRSGILVSHANEIAWLAEAHRLAGRPDTAAALAREAAATAVAQGERGNEAMAQLVLAEALLQAGGAGAAGALAAAAALAAECGMQPMAAQCTRLGHAPAPTPPTDGLLQAAEPRMAEGTEPAGLLRCH